MSNHLTDAQYAAFIDRLIACRQAEDDAKEDTKQVYAELADAGEDKTVAGLIVREQRMSEKDRVKANVRERALDEAGERYRRGKASHVRAREAGVETDADGVVTNDEEISETPMSNASGQPGGADPVTPDDAASAGATAPNTRRMSMTPLEPREAGGLKGFGFTVRFDEQQAAVPARTAGSETAVAAGAPEGEHSSHASDPIEPAAPLAAVAADGDSVADPAAVAVAPAKNDYSKPNPICADPDECGVHGSWNFTCGTCLRRADARRHEASAVH